VIWEGGVSEKYKGKGSLYEWVKEKVANTSTSLIYQQ